MKLLIEISDDDLKRIQSATRQEGRAAILRFIGQAVDAHLDRIEKKANGHYADGDVRSLLEQMNELRDGQRAIAAIMDSSATILAKMLRGPRGDAQTWKLSQLES